MISHKHGGDIYENECRIDFSANVNPFGMPPAVVAAAQAAVAKSVAYPDVNCRALREAIAKKENVAPEQIICGNGAAELIFLAAAAAKPKRALLVSPGFAEYEQALLAQACSLSFYELKEERGFALGEDYLLALEEKPDMIFLCNPNNPTGVAIEEGLLFQILERCKKLGIAVVLDLCFVDFLEAQKQAKLPGLLENYPNLFLLKAFTKTYAMAGLRLGYGLCAKNSQMMEKMQENRQPWSVSIPAQEAGVAALSEDAYVKRTRDFITAERSWLKKELEKCGLRVFDSQANFLFFEGWEDLEKYCAGEGILIRDCSNYRGLRAGYFRVAVRTHEENLELVRVIRKARQKK